MKRRLFIVCILFIYTCASALAQTGYSNLEFIENRGQLDKKFGFKAQMNNGSFLLQKQGFTVILHNTDDLNIVRTIAHGHSPEHSENQIATKSPGSAKTVVNKNTKYTIRSHAYEVGFVNANENPEIVPDKPLPTYNNYFIGNDPANWATHCKIYQGVTYKNIYSGIDVRYYTENGRLKYDIIVHPGADANVIAMKYTGADKLSIKQNQLITHTSVTDVKEFVPHSFDVTNTSRTEVDCNYVIDANNTVRFKLGKHNKDATLIIDPTWIFTTFTGSRSDNWGYTATYDAAGNFYSGSIVLNDRDGGNGFRVSPGAFQTTFQGGDGSEGAQFSYDVGIMKFNPTGTTMLYATYLGGSGDEQPHSLVVDNAGNLVVAGRTSSGDFPTGAGGVYGSGGSFDIFLTKFNANGTNLIGSRRIGGTGWDGVNIAPKYYYNPGNGLPMGQLSLRLNYGDDGRSEVIVDASNNIYLASCTQSTDFPCTANAFKNSSGGKQDGVFIKTNPDLSVILASSYLGGNADDAAFALALNPTNGDVYVGGGTASSDFPGRNNAPVLFNALNGSSIDGFVSIISNDGGTLKRTSYFGTSGTEVIYGVQFDKKGFPYIMGTTTGAWPVTPASVWSQVNGKQFVAKLQPDLNGWIYSTVFGKGDIYPDISPTAFLVDRCENVYVAGWGGGIESEVDGKYNNSTTSGLYTTADALKKTTDGADFYFIVMKKNMSAPPLYATFFGQNGGRVGDHVDGGTSRFDQQGIIYEAICANCAGGATFPTTPGAWFPTNGALAEGGCNLAAVKIAFNFAGVAADLRSMINGRYDSSGCVPLDVTFVDTIRNAKNYIWNFGDGTPDSATTAYQVTHTYQNIGTYKVRLIAIDSNSCNVADTVYIDIRARNDKADVAFNSIKLPPCQSLAYRFDNISTPPAGKPFGATSFIWDFGDGSQRLVAGTASVNHSYASPGTYNVKLLLVDTNYCNFPDSAQKILRVAQLVKAQFETPTSGCIPYTAVFNNTSLAGEQFIWDFGDGSGSTDVNPTHVYNNIGTYTIKLIAIDTATCNKVDSTTLTINTHPKPTAAFTDQPIPPEFNKPTIFFNGSTGATHFKWFFGDGDSTLKSNMDTVIHQYRKTGTFQACLVALNQFECADTACLPVETLINPLLDVPNAFTPGRFGQNSTIKVQGFGISSLIFRIYNRWGKIVFESNDQNNGWDGTYKGNPQPMDVYVYTLDAVFFDGTRTTRSGDITLIR
ncbi:MAG: PKD domain-containing protein [Bacteroidetes bacterium]|nr:PKD domain-containing protein [Bacteroidota bacterium]